MALLPLLVFLLLYLGTSIAVGDFYKIPLTVAFAVSAIVAIATLRGRNMKERINIFSRGASSENMMLMIWIFILAGAFATSAKTMGSIDATVQLAQILLPEQMIIAGIFVASCFISLSVGTSVGTIAALVPIAAGLADVSGYSIAMMTAVVVGGAFFGDNLSFISDTTVVATQSQGCLMNDKFKANIRIVLPAAILVTVFYVISGFNGGPITSPTTDSSTNFILVIPYIAVLILAILGTNVLLTLFIGCLLTGFIGIGYDYFDTFGWMKAMHEGVMNMAELIIVTMLAGGILEVVRVNGGISLVTESIIKHVNGRRGAEIAIALVVTLVDFCTANNTVAIITVGPIVRQIADRYDISPRRAASLLDTFSCFAQSIIPYGAQLLIAAGLASVSPTDIIPYLYYPMALFISATVAIFAKKTT